LVRSLVIEDVAKAIERTLLLTNLGSVSLTITTIATVPADYHSDQA